MQQSNHQYNIDLAIKFCVQKLSSQMIKLEILKNADGIIIMHITHPIVAPKQRYLCYNTDNCTKYIGAHPPLFIQTDIMKLKLFYKKCIKKWSIIAVYYICVIVIVKIISVLIPDLLLIVILIGSELFFSHNAASSQRAGTDCNLPHHNLYRFDYQMD